MVDIGQVLELRKTFFLDDEFHGLSSLFRCSAGGKMREGGRREGGRREEVDCAAACCGALCCFVLRVSLFVNLFLRLPVYLVLLCCHAPCARESACLVYHCHFSSVCLLFEDFDFPLWFMFLLLVIVSSTFFQISSST